MILLVGCHVGMLLKIKNKIKMANELLFFFYFDILIMFKCFLWRASMKRKQVVLILLLSLFLIFPLQGRAYDKEKINDYSLINFNSVIKNSLILDQENTFTTDECNDSLLGDPNDENSVAWLLQQLLNYIRIIGPILVVILSSVEFAKIIIQSDDEAMAKAQKKLINRLILVAALFFIPTLVEVLLDLFGIMGQSTCGLK